MPGRKTRTVAVLLAAAFAAFSLGNAYAAGEVTLRLENADIQELIRWGAEHTGKNIILHPQAKGQVTMLAGAVGGAHARPANHVPEVCRVPEGCHVPEGCRVPEGCSP